MSETPARHLNLEGASNFRDLGGHVTSDRRTVRTRTPIDCFGAASDSRISC